MADAPDTARRFYEQQKRLSRWGLFCLVIAVPGFFAFARQRALGAFLVVTAIAIMIGAIFVYSRCPNCMRLIMRRSVDAKTGVCVSCGAILTIDVSREVATIANDETKAMRLLRVRHQTFRNFRVGAIFALGMFLYILYDNGLTFPTGLIMFGAFLGWCVYTAWNDYRCPNCEAPLSRYILLDSKATSCPACSTALRLTG